MSANPDTAAPTGRKKTIGHRASAIGDSAKPPAALGHASQNTSSPEGAKEGGKIPIGAVTETRVEQTGPESREFTAVDIGSIDRETKRIVDPKVLPAAKAPSRAKQLLKSGDVLVSMTRPNLNAVAFVPSDKLIRCQLVSSGALPDFVAIMANVGASRNYLAKRVRTTAGQAGISGGDLKGLPIPLAPLAEQSRIVAAVERRLSVVEELESMASANLQRATRLRQSILQRAFTGDLFSSRSLTVAAIVEAS